MKKILFLLLITASANSQALFDKGIKITGGINTDDTSTKVVVQSANNVLNTVLKSSLKDVIEVTNYASLPATGVISKLYVTQDTNKLYRWNGTDYVDVSNTDLTGVELTANKSGTLTASSTLYPNNDAVIAGLATKQNTISGTANVIPKYGTGGLVASNFSDSGTLTSSSTDMTINSLRVGRGAGNSSLNVTMGTNSLISNTGGTNNLAIGSTAMRFNTTGSNNTAMAGRALENNISGGNNVGLGFGALLLNNSGNQNIGIGSSSIANSTVGNENIGIGFASLFNMTSGSSNTAIGESAGRYIANGSSSATSLDNSTLIGYRARPNDNGQTNQLVVGYDAVGLGSNTTVIGNSSTQFTRVYGNLLINKNTNNGKPVQINGEAEVASLSITTTPTTSTGTPDIVTRNTTTGVLESVPYSTFTSASNAVLLTGNQTKTGILTFNHSNGNNNHLLGQSTGTNPVLAPIKTNVTSSGSGSFSYITGAGSGFFSQIQGSGSGFGSQGITGTSAVGYIAENETGANGDLFQFKLGGNIVGKFNNIGELTVPKISVAALNTAPASATATGTTGEIRVTATHIYVCTATNTWVRSALTTW